MTLTMCRSLCLAFATVAATTTAAQSLNPCPALMSLRRLRHVRGADGDELESDFAVRIRATGTRTEFQISYVASGHKAGVARRIVFSPRKWLERELRLKEQA